MALVLNGSANTIGGLAVGGLPDGSVDTDTLADGAVTTDKSGAGLIVQTKTFTKTSVQAITSNQTWTSVLTDTAITPKFSNSRLLISYNFLFFDNLHFLPL